MSEKRKKEMRPETKEKLRKLALEKHKQGKFGGKKFGKMGGRPRKDRTDRLALDSVSEAANALQNRESLINVFKDAVHEAQPMQVRLRGAESWLAIQREQAKLDLQEEQVDQKQFDRNRVIALLAEKLTNGPAGDAIQAQIEGNGQVIEGTAIEDEPEFKD